MCLDGADISVIKVKIFLQMSIKIKQVRKSMHNNTSGAFVLLLLSNFRFVKVDFGNYLKNSVNQSW
jgi:hypothetical protein